ncbi:hypothetical protein [Agrobacterium tumefaciens]|uniref:hypothetical protein n=1 Tax=Agrobacterium tumefaciens TaxID=358 RepID=UPI0015752AB8|nr:hypothetical protein [Agrobacterium tumefaciens]NTZ91998.1 hypothetical protein [Agrobacterium tumefaciens]
MENLEGIMFLAEHEAENILINYADIVTYIENDVSLHGLGKRSASDIDDGIEEIVYPQYWAALCKYVSYERHKAKLMSGALANTFYADASSWRSMKSIKDAVTSKNGDWRDFMVRFKEMRNRTEGYLNQLGDEERKKARRRLADGKIALAKIQSVFGLKATWQGHLVKEVAASAYSTDFRKSLFDKTGIKT